MDSVWSDTAAWVQAIGTIAAVVGSGWVAARESRRAERREQRTRRERAARERSSLVAAKTAALNLAILAATQIHELHALLRDETRRGRVARVSPSRTFVTNERLLTAFPIQSLGDAEAMVAFAYFPGALAMAAEVYGNLEAAVRAVDSHQRAHIYFEYAAQMDRLDRTAQERLAALKAALRLPDAAAIVETSAGPHPSPHAAQLAPAVTDAHESAVA